MIPPFLNPSEIGKHYPQSIIVDSNQALFQSSLTDNRLSEKQIVSCTVGHMQESEFSDSETVFVTTEDDGAEATVTFLKNSKDSTFSKKEEVVQTEYIIHDNQQTMAPQVNKGKILSKYTICEACY